VSPTAHAVPIPNADARRPDADPPFPTGRPTAYPDRGVPKPTPTDPDVPRLAVHQAMCVFTYTKTVRYKTFNFTPITIDRAFPSRCGIQDVGVGTFGTEAWATPLTPCTLRHCQLTPVNSRRDQLGRVVRAVRQHQRTTVAIPQCPTQVLADPDRSMTSSSPAPYRVILLVGPLIAAAMPSPNGVASITAQPFGALAGLPDRAECGLCDTTTVPTRTSASRSRTLSLQTTRQTPSEPPKRDRFLRTKERCESLRRRVRRRRFGFRQRHDPDRAAGVKVSSGRNFKT